MLPNLRCELILLLAKPKHKCLQRSRRSHNYVRSDAASVSCMVSPTCLQATSPRRWAFKAQGKPEVWRGSELVYCGLLIGWDDQSVLQDPVRPANTENSLLESNPL